MIQKQKLLLATDNRGKIREMKNILRGLPFTFITMEDIGMDLAQTGIEETGKTFTENAVIKAEFIGKKSGILTIADDSGLIVDVLGGRPGVFSHRYGKTTKERNWKLLRELNKIPEEKRSARFVTAVAVYDPKTDRTYTFEGKTEGKITGKLLGSEGFGYDPLFYSSEIDKTFAQATLKEKNSVSHRGRALRKARRFLLKLTKNSP